MLSKLHFKAIFVSLGVFLFFIACAIALFFVLKNNLDRKIKTAFEAKTQDIIETTDKNLSSYIQVLYGVHGLFSASDQVERDEFTTYTNALNLKSFFPGLYSVRFVEVLDGNFVVKYASEEEEEEEEEVIGFVASSDPIRKETMEKARDTNNVAISSQIENLFGGQPGVIIVIPIHSSEKLDTMEQRRENILGFISALVRTDDFFNKSVLMEQKDLADLRFEAIDDQGNNLFEYGISNGKKSLFFSETYQEIPLRVANREWIFHFRGDPEYSLTGIEKYFPWILLIAGFFISFLFAFIVFGLYYTRIRVILRAEELSEELHKTEEEQLELLEKSSRKLSKQNKELSETKTAMVNLLEDMEKEKEKISQENAKNQTLLSSIGDGVVATDGKGLITWINEAAEKMIQQTSAEILGKKYTDIIPLYDENMHLVEEKKRKIQQVLSKGIAVRTSVANLTHYYARKDGTKFPTAVSTTPIILGGKIIGAIAVFRDIAYEKNIDRAKSEEFVSLASHQLRTPLSTIGWYTEMLLAGDAGILNEEQKKFLQEIYRGNKRMVELVNALLNVSRLELGTFMIEPAPSNFSEIAEDVLKELAPQIQTKKMEIARNFDSGLPLINADPKLIRIIFQNLLSNAVKYTPEKGTIDISINRQNSDIMITVADNGYGIPREAQEKIFTKLFRADNAKKKDADGTGLGLYIIKSIVDNSGGKISFKSELNKGTTFQVSFPASGMIKKEGAKQLG